MFKTLLVPTDGSPLSGKAIDAAIALPHSQVAKSLDCLSRRPAAISTRCTKAP